MIRMGADLGEADMDDREYQKLFDHFTDLSQRYALGKIQHDALRDGLKKLLAEIIDVEVGKRKRAAFRLGWAVCLVFVLALGGSVFFAWRSGWVLKGIKAVPLDQSGPVKKPR